MTSSTFVTRRLWKMNTMQFFRSSQVFKETPLLKNPISSQESMQLSQILVNLWASFGRFIKSTHSNKICSGNILGRQWLENWIPYMAYCTYTKCKILLLQDYLFHFLKITNESCTKLSLPKSAYTALPLGLLS